MKRLIGIALATLTVAALGSPAMAGPQIDDVPTNGCELAAFIGVQNVRECGPVE